MARPDQVISTILKHDSKVTSYKMALLRAINDVVLAFPDVGNKGRDVAIPLRLLAAYWIAYYWPFVDARHPIWQGQRARLGGTRRNDMAFRPALTQLRQAWAQIVGGASRSSDGFFVINELRVPRRRQGYPEAFVARYEAALQAVAHTIQMPIRYAGPGEWQVFDRPAPRSALGDRVTAVPGTRANDRCLVIGADLWDTFRRLSLWVEALCIHEWCLFTERFYPDGELDRGVVYALLTERPDNRRPLTWERHQVDLLLLEGEAFVCPWTEKRIRQSTPYDLDHLVPVAVYPTNELWNLVPSDPRFNMHRKRDRLPTPDRLARARPHLTHAYSLYSAHQGLDQALQEDVATRFTGVREDAPDYAAAVTTAVVNLVEQLAASRNLSRF